MENNSLISIIVPIYNSEQYLNRCIDSVLSQTYSNFELILVDDGSKDNSGVICDGYVKKDSRVRVTHLKNGGVTHARAIGVEMSKGDWITFIDSDDTIPKNALSQYIKAVHRDKVDIVMFSSRDLGTSHPVGRNISIYGTMSSDKYIQAMLTRKCSVGPVCKLFKKSLFNNKTFNISPEIRNNEDLIMNLKLAKECHSISVYPGIIAYNYYYTPGSASKNKLSITAWDKIFEQILLNVDSQYDNYLKECIACKLFFMKRSLTDYKSSKYYQYIFSSSSKQHFLLWLYKRNLRKNDRFSEFIIKNIHKMLILRNLMIYFFSKHVL